MPVSNGELLEICCGLLFIVFSVDIIDFCDTCIYNDVVLQAFCGGKKSTDLVITLKSLNIGGHVVHTAH